MVLFMYMYVVFVNHVLCQRHIRDRCGCSNDLASTCITDDYLYVCNSSCPNVYSEQLCQRGKLFVCYTCDRHLKSGMVPPKAIVNKTDLEKLDFTFTELNTVERQLLALCLPFQKSYLSVKVNSQH